MQISHRTEIKFTTTLTLSEDQVGALDALVGYGLKSFKEVFYKHLGEAYMKPHEKGLEELFNAIETQVRPELGRIQEVRRKLAERTQ